jgi:nicotinate phosphoribosyltransferase
MLTDFYELTMLESYFAQGMNVAAVFDLFVRRLPPGRNYLVACGLEDVLHDLETFSLSADDLSYLRSLKRLYSGFIDNLAHLRFTGDVYAAQTAQSFLRMNLLWKSSRFSSLSC